MANRSSFPDEDVTVEYDKVYGTYGCSSPLNPDPEMDVIPDIRSTLAVPTSFVSIDLAVAPIVVEKTDALSSVLECSSVTSTLFLPSSSSLMFLSLF